MRLIDADAVFKLVKGFRDTKPEDITRRKYVCNAILLVLQDEKELPTIDAAPVVHGRWKCVGTVCIDGEYEDILRCSKCSIPHDRKSRYCPNCGARMDGE